MASAHGRDGPTIESPGRATACLDVSMAVRFGHRVSRSKLKFKWVFENERVGCLLSPLRGLVTYLAWNLGLTPKAKCCRSSGAGWFVKSSGAPLADGPMLSAAAELINQILRSCFVQCIGKKTGGRVSHGGATASLDVSMAVRFGHRVS